MKTIATLFTLVALSSSPSAEGRFSIAVSGGITFTNDEMFVLEPRYADFEVNANRILNETISLKYYLTAGTALAVEVSHVESQSHLSHYTVFGDTTTIFRQSRVIPFDILLEFNRGGPNRKIQSIVGGGITLYFTRMRFPVYDYYLPSDWFGTGREFGGIIFAGIGARATNSFIIKTRLQIRHAQQNDVAERFTGLGLQISLEHFL